jgi:hypothetical protein
LLKSRAIEACALIYLRLLRLLFGGSTAHKKVSVVRRDRFKCSKRSQTVWDFNQHKISASEAGNSVVASSTHPVLEAH